MNDKSKQCDHKTDWLTALDFVKGIQGSSTHLKFLIYEKTVFYMILEIIGFFILNLTVILVW